MKAGFCTPYLNVERTGIRSTPSAGLATRAQSTAASNASPRGSCSAIREPRSVRDIRDREIELVTERIMRIIRRCQRRHIAGHQVHDDGGIRASRRDALGLLVSPRDTHGPRTSWSMLRVESWYRHRARRRRTSPRATPRSVVRPVGRRGRRLPPTRCPNACRRSRGTRLRPSRIRVRRFRARSRQPGSVPSSGVTSEVSLACYPHPRPLH